MTLNRMSFAEGSDAVLRGIGKSVTSPVDVRVNGVQDATIRNALESGIGDLIGGQESAADRVDISSNEEPAPGLWDLGLVGAFDTASMRGRIADYLEKQHRSIARSAFSTPASGRCVCATTLPGNRIQPSNAQIRWWNPDGTFTRPPADAVEWTVALYPVAGSSDALRISIRDGSAAIPRITKSQVLVGLANRTDWAKEIWAINICTGRTQSVFQSKKNATYQRMLLDKAACRAGSDTIVFRKPGFFGVWIDIANFAPAWFWPAFGGTVLDFEWAFD
jgi:hypothetical protein